MRLLVLVFISLIFFELGFAQTCTKDTIQFYEIAYKDSSSIMKFFYCSDNEKIYPSDYFQFENMNVLRNSPDSVPYSLIAWNEHVAAIIADAISRSESIELFNNNSVKVSCRGCKILTEYTIVPISAWIPVPFELGIELRFALTPIAVDSIVDFSGSNVKRDLNFFRRYYYEVIGFVNSELMFFYGLE